MLPQYLGILYDQRFHRKILDDVEEKGGNLEEKIMKTGLVEAGRGNKMNGASIHLYKH